MNTITLSTGTKLEVRLLHDKEYYGDDAVLFAEVSFSDGYSFDDYEEEKRSAEERLRALLRLRWTEIDDFEVAIDVHTTFAMCGGIYSPRVICREYLETLHRVLQDTRMQNRWLYSTSIELDSPMDGMMLCVFSLRANVITVNIEDTGEFDFVRAFSRSAKEAEDET